MSKKARREFLEVIPADEAKARFWSAVDPSPVGTETVVLEEALGRVLADDVVATIDVPGFDRANVDGFAVRASDTFGADEAHPKELKLTGEILHPGVAPTKEVGVGEATEIATGGMLPRGADAVVMIEHVELEEATIEVKRAAAPGSRLAFAGSDVARGERVIRVGTRLTARETGTLAALGVAEVNVYRRPRIGVLSTGDEIIAPGEPMRPGLVYDSNLRIVSDTLRELGCEPVPLGIVRDDVDLMRQRVEAGLTLDGLLLSGGTSKGGGDYSATIVAELTDVVCHGVAVKPGKPLCLAAYGGKPIAVLPGFPTSAVFTFHEFLAPVLTAMTGTPADHGREVTATLPLRIELDRGRAEFVLVHLIETDRGLVAYPMHKGSGSVTTFSQADGFITLDRRDEYIDAGAEVTVRLIGRDVTPADLVVIGSHCVGLDIVLSKVQREGFAVKNIVVGSQGGFLAAERGECDLGGVHLCDESGEYNRPFLRGDVELLTGYQRQQGIVTRPGEEVDLASSRMINRNRGSGTRILIDALLRERNADDPTPDGYVYEAKSHNAVAAAVAQGRADWGVAIENVAKNYDLNFEPLRAEQYDFVMPTTRRDRAAVDCFRRVLADADTRAELASLGFETNESESNG